MGGTSAEGEVMLAMLASFLLGNSEIILNRLLNFMDSSISDFSIFFPFNIMFLALENWVEHAMAVILHERSNKEKGYLLYRD